MDTIILVITAVFGIGASVTTLLHAYRTNIDRPLKWSGIVGLTFFLSPIVVDEVAFYLLRQVTNVFYPLYYHAAVFGLALAIGAIAALHYHRSATPV